MMAVETVSGAVSVSYYAGGRTPCCKASSGLGPIVGLPRVPPNIIIIIIFSIIQFSEWLSAAPEP